MLVLSIVRLIAVLRIDHTDLACESFCRLPHDVANFRQASMVMAQIWSCIEASFGVISACIPSLTPFFHMMLGKQVWSRRQSAESRLMEEERRRSSAPSAGNLTGQAIEKDLEAVDSPNTSQSRNSTIHQKSRFSTPEDDLFRDIEDQYSGLVVTHSIDQETSDQVGASTKETFKVRETAVD